MRLVALGNSLDKKGGHRADEQPSVFSEKGDYLACYSEPLSLSDKLVFEVLIRNPKREHQRPAQLHERPLPLYCKPYAGGARDSEKFFNPEVVVNVVPNKVYSQGVEGRDLWEQVSRHFGTDNSEVSNMVATAFYTGDKFGLFIDLRSMVDRKMHGRSLRLLSTKDGVQLVKCYIFIISDAQLTI